jgi:chromosomal replication initiation ATPase DnaA
MGYDLTVQLEPADDDNLKGILNNMFDTKGIRIKENK